ncbi:hypothetical protein JIN84_18325 [Luteolibacter yonseiensis]|uniref:Uncharacterized protein n=1 Tax=Luteolibacter yonseiensis TaxID=1144680 RepID=A0A934VD23_9BACT|nr:hypothetical protein [Luteolibacter yonseiensis]MBK1817581.1 hypothetical protein [Luteolibacter yonseiensis]
MKFNPENPSQLAEKILEAENKLHNLELEIAEIGLPAGQELLRRLNALKVEENALKRNFEESVRRGEPDSVRLEKIEALLAHIEREEDSMEHDAHFLHQAAPSSMALAVEASVQVADLLSRGVKKVIGNHHPLGESVFVNHTHDNLASQYGVEDHDHPEKASRPPGAS